MKKNKWQIEYRNNGSWVEIYAPFPTKALANEAAKKSGCCIREGYQVRKLK